MKLAQPWPEGYFINARSPFGWRIHPITKKRKFHHGVDVALPVGTELRAPAAGIIQHKGSGGFRGKHSYREACERPFYCLLPFAEAFAF